MSRTITMARESTRERMMNKPDLGKLTSSAQAAASRRTKNGTASRKSQAELPAVGRRESPCQNPEKIEPGKEEKEQFSVHSEAANRGKHIHFGGKQDASDDQENANVQTQQDQDRYPIVLGRRKGRLGRLDRKSTRLNSSHSQISYAVFCLKKKEE